MKNILMTDYTNKSGAIASIRFLDASYEGPQFHTNTRNGVYASPVSRNVYAISMKNISTDVSTMSGSNTVVSSPLEILMKSSGKTYTGPSNGISFAQHDTIVYIKPNLQIIVLGR